jgi:transcription elongation factor GreA
MKEKILTPEGAEKIRAELKHLTETVRPALALRLRSAIQQGDLSENADYISAKEEQGFLEGRILELETLIKIAVVIDPATTRRDVVSLGCRVTVSEDSQETELFHIVGSNEANPRAGKISHESPIGKALLGHSVGEIVQVNTPAGNIHFRIEKIE